MMKRFKKLLSALCIIALLVSSIATVFANGDNDTEMPAPQEDAVKTTVNEAVQEAEAVSAQIDVDAVKEEPAQKDTSAQENTPSAAGAPSTENNPEQNDTAGTEKDTAQDTEPAAEPAPAQETAPALDAAPVQEDAAANGGEQNTEESVADTDTTPDGDYDELANEPVNYREEDLVELDDGAGYMDPEFIEAQIGEITPEMKYGNITEMKIGSTVSGSAGADEIFYYIKAERTQNIVLVLQANGNIRIRINERDVNFDENENENRTYEMKVQSGDTCIIAISGNGSFRLTAEVKPVGETAEETAGTDEEENTATEDENGTPVAGDEASEEIIDNTEADVPGADDAEGNTEKEDAGIENGGSVEAETENTDNSENLNSEEGTEPAETVEEGTGEAEPTEAEETEEPQTAGEETAENAAEDTEEAAEEPEPKIVTWVTATVNEDEGTVTVYANAETELDNQIVWQTRSADSDEWKKAGYGLKLTVEVTEENANNFFRFRLADGTYSPEYQIHVTVETAAEETEEAVEEISAETEETEAAEEPEEAGEGAENNEETADTEEEAASEVTANIKEETDSEEVEAAEGTEEAPAENDKDADGEAEVTNEEAEAEEKTEEDAESKEETEENPDAESEEDAEENPDAESEEDAEETEETEEETEEAEPLTEEQMIELGYRKIQILNQNGTDIYDSITEEAVVIGYVETGTELWIRDTESEGWAEIYTEDGSQQFLKLAEAEKQKPTDEEMLAKGYVKCYVAMNIGANIYTTLDGQDEHTEHVDAGEEFWVELIEGASRALIIDFDEEAPARYIKLVDIIATLKPEGMDNLPTREITIHSPLDDTDMLVVFVGTRITLTTELINFHEDDKYVVKWQYSEDGEEFIDIPDANELEFTYIADQTNGNYIWKVFVNLVSTEE